MDKKRRQIDRQTIKKHITIILFWKNMRRESYCMEQRSNPSAWVSAVLGSVYPDRKRGDVYLWNACFSL